MNTNPIPGDMHLSMGYMATVLQSYTNIVM